MILRALIMAALLSLLLVPLCAALLLPAIFTGGKGGTGSTSTPTVGKHLSVDRVEGMTPLALSLIAARGAHRLQVAPLDVDKMRHGFQVLGVDARTITAEMVEFMGRGNGSDHPFIDNAVCQPSSAIDVEATVAHDGVAGPRPTAGLVSPDLLHESPERSSAGALAPPAPFAPTRSSCPSARALSHAEIIQDGNGCEPIPITWWSPTGIKGCEQYGTGTASMWGGPGVARNDCVWPWTDCRTIAIQSLQTGLVIIVTPSMYGDLYLGDADPSNDRIVDLDPGAVAALGLRAEEGLWRVRVDPMYVAPTLPDTAMEPVA